MINVSDAFEQKIENGFPVTEEVQITFANGVVKTVREEILNADNEIADGVDGNSFPIGTTVCKTCGLALDNSEEQWKDYDFYGAKLKVRLKMTLDDGTDLECVVLTIFEAADKEYIALLPLDGNEAEDGEVYLYRYSEDAEGNPDIQNIESDEEYEIVADAFDEFLDTAEYDEIVSEEDLDD